MIVLNVKLIYVVCYCYAYAYDVNNALNYNYVFRKFQKNVCVWFLILHFYDYVYFGQLQFQLN